MYEGIYRSDNLVCESFALIEVWFMHVLVDNWFIDYMLEDGACGIIAVWFWFYLAYFY